MVSNYKKLLIRCNPINVLMCIENFWKLDNNDLLLHYLTSILQLAYQKNTKNY